MKKTTNQKTTLKKRILAVILSAVTVCSVTTMAFTPTVFAAGNDPDVSLGLDITDTFKVTMDKDLITATKITSGVIFKVLEEATPWGKFLTPALQGLLDASIGAPEDPTQQKLDEINDKLDRLFEKIDESEVAIKASIETDLGLQSFYETFVKFKSSTEAMNDKIHTIMNEDLSNAEKMAKIGSLTGSYSEWRSNYEDTLTALNAYYAKPSMTASGTVFDLTYNHYSQSVMFSGEAIDKSRPICDYVMQVYSAGCSTLLESLSAQLYVNCLTDETKATISPEYMSHICNNPNDIYSEMQMISKKLVGEQTNKIDSFVYPDGTVHELNHREMAVFVNSNGDPVVEVNDSSWDIYPELYPDLRLARYVLYVNGNALELKPVYASSPDTIRYMYNKTMRSSRSILVDKGHSNISLRSYLDVLNHKDDPNANGKHGWDKGDRSKNWFNSNIGGGPVSSTLITEIAKYAKERGISIRTLLNNNGFDTSNLPANTNIVTKNAWDNSTNEASIIIGYNYQQSFYKGINIDDKQATEKEIQVLDCGYNFWTDGEWGFSVPGFACRFAQA